MGAGGSPSCGASPLFEPDVIEIADAGGVRVVAVAEYGDIDQVRRRGIFPDLAIDATEVDPLVKPAANSVIARVDNEVWETADVFCTRPVLAGRLVSVTSFFSSVQAGRQHLFCMQF